MQKIYLDEFYLNKLFCVNRCFCDIYYDKDKVYKLFRINIDEALIKELEYLNSLNLNSITNQVEFIVIDNQIKGFSMKYFNGFNFDFYYKKYLEKIKLLNLAKQEIENIHKYPIIIGDLHDGNILHNENKVIFCDPDGFIFNKTSNKRKNIWENDYFEHFKIMDKRCDIYLFNILTLSLILKKSWSSIRHSDFYFKSDELNKIMEFINDFKENEYSNKYIIDYLPETEKEFKKLTKI